MFTSDYWNNRAKKFGHTGHSEPFHYCFDQQARLYAIDEIIKSLTNAKNSAFDFGCGSGDFIELLSQHYSAVYGYDISETVINQTLHRFEKTSVVLLDKFNSVLTEKKFDLILTVTVLQTLPQKELEKTLAELSQLLSKNGVIASMEFFASEERNLKSNETRTTYKEWQDLLIKNNLQVVTTERFYNPVEFPSTSWLLYKKNLFLKLLRILKHSPLIQTYFKKMAKKLITQYKDVFPKNDSNYYIYVIKKSDHNTNYAL